MDEQVTPGGIVIPGTEEPLPSIQQTVSALDEIGPKRAEHAGKALRILCERLIGTVCEVDRELNVSQYLNSVTILVKGTGSYVLQIDDANTGVDKRQIEQDVAELFSRGEHDKLLRSINIEPRHGQVPTPLEHIPTGPCSPLPAEGPAGSPADEVAGGWERFRGTEP
jgi:hypothetical protein